MSIQVEKVNCPEWRMVMIDFDSLSMLQLDELHRARLTTRYPVCGPRLLAVWQKANEQVGPPSIYTINRRNYDRLHNHRHSGRSGRPIRCLETGDEYPSGVAAAKALGVVPSTIVVAIRRGHRIKGKRFEYVGGR